MKPSEILTENGKDRLTTGIQQGQVGDFPAERLEHLLSDGNETMGEQRAVPGGEGGLLAFKIKCYETLSGFILERCQQLIAFLKTHLDRAVIWPQVAEFSKDGG